MSTHEKDKMVIFGGFEEPKGQAVGAAQGVGWFGLNIRKLKFTGAFSLEKTCELLFVRGTTSFYNKKSQIFPVGEGAVWNVQMWSNEQCWRGTILFFTVFH